MATRGSQSASRGGRQVQNVVQEQSESDFEPADLIVGVILFLMIPFGAYILLHFVGMPVGGAEQPSWEESLERKETKKKRPPPPLNEKEYGERFARIESLLDNYVRQYRKYSRAEEEPRPKHFYYECAQKCLQIAEHELQALDTEVKRSPDLRHYEQNVASRLNQVAQTRHDLVKEKVFLSR